MLLCVGMDTTFEGAVDFEQEYPIIKINMDDDRANTEIKVTQRIHR